MELLIRDIKFKDLRGEYFHELETAVEQENYNQIQKWGVQEERLFEWAAWTTEEFGEFIKALNDFVYGRTDHLGAVKEGIQTITLLMKMVEILENLLIAQGEERVPMENERGGSKEK